MKIRKLGYFGTGVLVAALWTGCSGQPKASSPAEAAGEKASVSRVQHGTNGEVLVRVSAETQQLMGLRTTALQPARVSREIKAYGRVLDTAPLAGLVAELQTAKAAQTASQAELQRLRTLKAQDNTSEKAFQAAEAAAVRDDAQWQSTRLRLQAGWGSVIADRADLASLVATLAAREGALVELAVPAGEAPALDPIGARITTLAEGTNPAELRWVGLAPTAAAQERSYWFLLVPNALHLVPGTTVNGFLRLPGAAETGVMVPQEAIVQHEGVRWVYAQTSETTFERRELAPGRPSDGGWFVREGLKPDVKVVTTGAQQLLSEELKGGAE